MKSVSVLDKKFIWILIVLQLVLLRGCQDLPFVQSPSSAPIVEQIPPGMSEAEGATLSSLEQIDPFPLYIMSYFAEYDQQGTEFNSETMIYEQTPAWVCSLFAAMGDPEDMFFGRNFDWDFSPALMLFTDPPHGYASVSMVDIAYLGYGEERAFNLTDLPLSARIGLLYSPYLPFDGMNEAGLAVGMAAVPLEGMEYDPKKETIDSLMVIREILDRAASIEEAEIILENYNIDWGSGPDLHYLIAEKSGRSVLVEFTRGEMIVIPNTDLWQVATNFLISETSSAPENQCWRYGLISQQLVEQEGQMNARQALNLLSEVAQESTQWSVVYGISTGEIQVVMGRQYGDIHNMTLD